MLDQPPQNKMMTAPPAKKEFHFAGGGIWRNATILADTIEEAEKLWHVIKQLIEPKLSMQDALDIEAPQESYHPPAEQSTVAPAQEQEETKVQ